MNSQGKRVVSGGPKLKETQAYTAAFGDAVMRQHLVDQTPTSKFAVDDVFGERAGTMAHGPTLLLMKCMLIYSQ